MLAGAERSGGTMSHHHHHHHDHHGPGGHSHDGGLLDPGSLWRPDVHRIDRRRFVADLGRRTFAMAILGTGLAACSSSSGNLAAPTTAPTAAPTDPPAEPTVTQEPEPTEAEAEAELDEEEPPAEAALETLMWSQVLLGNVSAFVLVRGNQAAVVDTGNPGAAGDIGNALNTFGVNYSNVAHVILTHQHRDHVGSLNEVLAEAPSAVAYAGEADIAFINSDNALQAVGDGDSVFGLDVINTPGHTPGSISVLDREIGLLLAGDALNGTSDGDRVLGPNRQFSSNLDSANNSVKKLAELQFDAAGFGHGSPVESGAGALVAALAAEL